MFEKTREYLDEFVRRGIPGMDICVMQNGKEIFREWRGVSDEAGTPMNGRERYNIYSCSKVFTCTAAMMLVEEGRLSLDDELATYLPEFAHMQVKTENGLRDAKTPITVRHLFTMTAGLSYNMESDEISRGIQETEGKGSTREMMKYIAKMPLEFEPGEKWNYSLCHDVLAAVVEVVAGKRFGLFVKERIFDVCGMTDSTFLLPREELPTLSAQYLYEHGEFKNVGREIQRYKIGESYESGGAGAISTVGDYIRFLEGLRTYRLLKPETVALMARDQLTKEQDASYWNTGDYSYGLGVRAPLAENSSRTDFGWGGAAGAYLSIDPVNNLSVYYAQHVLASPNGALRKDIIEAVKLDLGLDAATEGMWNGRGNSLA